MSSLYKPNPANDTRWFVIKDNIRFRMKVLGATFSGFTHTYKTISYELKYDHLDQVQVIEADKFKQLINEGLVQPDYNTAGSLIWE